MIASKQTSLNDLENISSRSHLYERVPLLYSLCQHLRSCVSAIDIPNEFALLVIHKDCHHITFLYLVELATFWLFDQIQNLASIDFAIFAVHVVNLIAIAVDTSLLPSVLRHNAYGNHSVKCLHYLNFQVVYSSLGNGVGGEEHKLLICSFSYLDPLRLLLNLEILL